MCTPNTHNVYSTDIYCVASAFINSSLNTSLTVGDCLIICGPPYHLPNTLMTPHLDCSTQNRILECLTAAGSCLGVWRRCWTGNPTLHVLCMVPRSVKGVRKVGRKNGGGGTSGLTHLVSQAIGKGKGGQFFCLTGSLCCTLVNVDDGS